MIDPESSNTVAESLLKSQKIDQATYDELIDTAQKTGQNVDALILERKILNSEEFAQTKGQLFNIPYIDLRESELDPEALKSLPEETVAHYEMIAFRQKDETLEVAMVNPTDFRALEALEFITSEKGQQIKKYITSTDSFHVAYRKFSTLSQEIHQVLESEASEEDAKQEAAANKGKKVETIIEEAPVSKAVSVILKHAVKMRSSDIHIEPVENSLRVRYRVDGTLKTTLSLPLELHEAIISRIKILANLKIDEKRKPQDGRFHSDIDDIDIDLRVSSLPTTNGEKIVIRILDKSAGIQPLKDLGFNPQSISLIKESIAKPFGMILLTGPTGSGKSTTSYSILNILNKEETNIITLEDPVEYYLPGVNQSQIKPKIGYTFASGLRSILRQDPNVIMVGEIRDSETAELAVHAALTGHLVISTLHTNNAVGAIPRLVNMGVEPFLLTASLNLVIAQRLVKRICPKCKKEVPAPPEIEKMILSELETIPAEARGDINTTPPFKLYKGEGCPQCSKKGTKGRVAISEIISMTPELQELTTKGSNDKELLAEARRQGMITMKQDGIIKALEGSATIEEVLRVIED